MPCGEKRCDREEIVSIAIDMIVAGGASKVTHQSIADVLNRDISAIKAIFPTEADILREVYRRSMHESGARLDAVTALLGVPLGQAMVEMLPLDTPQRCHWTIWFNLWTQSLTEPTLLKDLQQGLSEVKNRFRDDLLAQGTAPAVAEMMVDDMIAVTQGIAIQAIADPQHWTPDRQRAAFARAIAWINDRARSATRWGDLREV